MDISGGAQLQQSDATDASSIGGHERIQHTAYRDTVRLDIDSRVATYGAGARAIISIRYAYECVVVLSNKSSSDMAADPGNGTD
jgi:hypothetical protein